MAKNIKDLCDEFFKQLKRIRQTIRNENTSNVHGLVDLNCENDHLTKIRLQRKHNLDQNPYVILVIFPISRKEIPQHS